MILCLLEAQPHLVHSPAVLQREARPRAHQVGSTFPTWRLKVSPQLCDLRQCGLSGPPFLPGFTRDDEMVRLTGENACPTLASMTGKWGSIGVCWHLPSPCCTQTPLLPTVLGGPSSPPLPHRQHISCGFSGKFPFSFVKCRATRGCSVH